MLQASACSHRARIPRVASGEADEVLARDKTRRVHREAAEREQAEAATSVARWQRRERERVGK